MKHAMFLIAGFAAMSATVAVAGPIKVKPLGPFQQRVVARGAGAVAGYYAGAGAATVVGPVGGTVVGAGVATAVGNHAEKKWTGKGLRNWNKPSRW